MRSASRNLDRSARGQLRTLSGGGVVFACDARAAAPRQALQAHSHLRRDERSLAALHTALMREIPHPLAEVPRVAFDAARGLCSRRAWPLLAARPPAGRHRLSSESRPRKILPTKTRMSPLTSQQHQVEQHAP
jgi:hypothetical protein